MQLETLDVELLPLLVAFAVVSGLGLFVGDFIERYTSDIRPKGAWKKDLLTGGGPIGFFERTVFLLAIIAGYPTFIGVWLLFKVGAKWQSWAQVVRFPNLIGSNLNSKEFEQRARFGNWLHARFVLGVLVNITISIVGAWIYLQLAKL